MLEPLQDLLINLAAAVIFFACGLFAQRFLTMFRRRVLRSFWAPFTKGAVRIAIGSFIEDEYYRRERAGFAGLGDIEAFVRLKRQLHDAGIREYDLLPSHQVSPEQLRDHLVLIGGPHSNSVSDKIMRQLPCTFTFGSSDGPIGKDTRIYDSRQRSATDCLTDEAGRLVSDQGLIIRCPNPYAPGKQILILAGSWGFGTTAATQLIESRDFLGHPVIASSDPFEATFSCRIDAGMISDVQIEKIRRLNLSPTTTTIAP
ncbi:hypothetical protein ACFQS3_10010 [Glycomyces mayteni]|uniref:S-layer protein C-terminal domain-containing protein n=1 Tax=Glycomyces mayteni TaxID=543887 RepID=A0ABW2D9C8_9ACTN|nr:hypothetical protein GCM10025732_29940 [Glycomyces mayteni]